MIKRAPLFACIVLCFFFGYFLIALFLGKKREKASAFSGVIQSIEYNAKGIPTVEIDGKKIHLLASFNWNHQIETGDFIEKKAGESVYKIIKHRNNSVIIFK